MNIKPKKVNLMQLTEKQKDLLLRLLMVPKFTIVANEHEERLFCGFIPGGLVIYKMHISERISKVCKIDEFLSWAGENSRISEGIKQ